MSSRPIYSIGAVGQMLGIAPATLRTWEERYGLPVPERSPGHRLYSRDQVDQLRFVKVQLAQGMAPADAHRLLAERLAAGWLSFDEPEAGKTRLLILLAERDPTRRAGGVLPAHRGLRGRRGARRHRRHPEGRGADPEHDRDRPAHLGRQRTGAVPAAQAAQHPDPSHLDLDSSDAALEAGADAFLQKPLDPLQLVSAVKDLLGASAFLRGTAGGLP